MFAKWLHYSTLSLFVKWYMGKTAGSCVVRVLTSTGSDGVAKAGPGSAVPAPIGRFIPLNPRDGARQRHSGAACCAATKRDVGLQRGGNEGAVCIAACPTVVPNSKSGLGGYRSRWAGI